MKPAKGSDVTQEGEAVKRMKVSYKSLNLMKKYQIAFLVVLILVTVSWSAAMVSLVTFP